MSNEEKYGFTRQYHVLLTDKQKIQHEKALKTQNALFQYALKYLFKTYGVKHIGRPMPFSQKPIQYVLNKIKTGFIKDKYGLARWKKSVLFLSSHSADEFLKTVYTNFSQYRKRLVKADKSMDEKARYNFKMNVTKDKYGKHKNQLHKSWYRKGSINFLRNSASFRTITSQKLPEDSKGGIRIEDKHTDNHTFLTIADFGTVEVIEDLSELNLKDIALTGTWLAMRLFAHQTASGSRYQTPQSSELTNMSRRSMQLSQRVIWKEMPTGKASCIASLTADSRS